MMDGNEVEERSFYNRLKDRADSIFDDLETKLGPKARQPWQDLSAMIHEGKTATEAVFETMNTLRLKLLEDAAQSKDPHIFVPASVVFAELTNLASRLGTNLTDFSHKNEFAADQDRAMRQGRPEPMMDSKPSKKGKLISFPQKPKMK